MPKQPQRAAAPASRRSRVQAGCYILTGTGLLILGALLPGINYTTKAGSFTHWPTPVVPVIVLALVIACLGIARLRSASPSRSLQVWAALAATAAGCFALPAIERYDAYHFGIGPWVALAGVVVVYLGHSRPRFFWNNPRG